MEEDTEGRENVKKREKYDNRGLGTCGSWASVRVISWSTLWKGEMSLKVAEDDVHNRPADQLSIHAVIVFR